MAREILFRGKRKDDKGWVTGDLRHGGYYNGDREICIMSLNSSIIINHPVYPETVGQFTGLNDKNGKKVFDGDILSTENGTFSNTGMGYILFYKGMWTSFYGQDGIGRDCFDELHTVCNSREVIGNIHDNPELLEGEFFTEEEVGNRSRMEE